MDRLADRVKRLREAKHMKQSELAAGADLDPAAISRILAGEREPRMEHLIAIARALGVTVVELVGGTDAEGAMREWVSHDQFAASETARLEALRDLELARVEIMARVSEVEALRATSQSQLGRLTALEQDLARLRGEAEEGKRQRIELTELRRRQAELEAERQGLAAQSEAYAKALVDANRRLQEYMRAYGDARARSEVIQRDLVAAKSGQVGALAVGALLAGLFGAAFTADTSPRRRSSRGTRRS